MKEINKHLHMVFAAVMALLLCFTAVVVVGCYDPNHPEKNPNVYRTEDFYYAYNTDKTEIHFSDGLTEQGKTKETLVVPKYVNDTPVKVLGTTWLLGAEFSLIKSPNLKNLYILPNVTINQEKIFYYCPNLEKVVFCSTNIFPAEELVPLKENGEGLGESPIFEDFKIYVPSFGNDSIETNVREKVYYTYNIFQGQHINYYFNQYYANISYMHNYDSAENEGYYWVDNFDYGEKIGYIPENPERDGYIFGGWYKEPECVTVWNFDTDTLPEAKYNEKGEELYQETRLYAKWYKN